MVNQKGEYGDAMYTYRWWTQRVFWMTSGLSGLLFWVTQHNQIILYIIGRLSDVCEFYYDEGPKGTYLFPNMMR
jgi:hypothetical protein